MGGKSQPVVVAIDENGPWLRKCEYGVAAQDDGKKGKKQRDKNETDNGVECAFIPEMPDLRKKRTVQNKVVEYLTLKLFSKQSIFYLVDILFKDMKDDYKRLENTKSDDDDDEEEQADEGKAAEDKPDDDADLSGEESDDPTRANVDLEKYMDIKGVLTIERIKDIVGEIMSSCQKKMKYEILETIMKGVIFQKKKLRESFMQEILNAQDSASYRLALQAHLNSESQVKLRKQNQHREKVKMTDDQAREQQKVADEWAKDQRRIINLNAVDMSNVLAQESASNDEQDDDNVKDPTFYNRLFVLTSKEILIMRNPPKGVRCATCPLSAFCPTEPTTRLSIRHEDIRTVINFPQLPQKLVIQYTSGHGSGRADWLLTLNIPTYTKCAKIYHNLMLIVKSSAGADQDQLGDSLTPQGTPGNSRATPTPGKNPGKTPGGRVPEKPDPSYVDQLVQYELRTLLKAQLAQIKCEKSLSKRKAQGLQLIYASLQYEYNDQSKMLISPEFFKKHVCRKSSNYSGKQTTKDLRGNSKGMFGFVQKKEAQGGNQDDDEEAIKNSVLVCIIPTHIILLKEHWDTWQFLKNPETLRDYKKSAIKKAVTPAQDPKDIANQIVADDPIQAHMEKRCNPDSNFSKIFKVVTMITMSQVRKLEVHRGKDPSVELKIAVDDIQGEMGAEIDPKELRSLQILFPGDMERQRFVEDVISMREPNEQDGLDDEEKDDGPAKEGEDADVDDDENEREVSDEDVGQATIYE